MWTGLDNARWLEIAQEDRLSNPALFARAERVYQNQSLSIEVAWTLVAEAPCHCDRMPPRKSAPGRRRCMPCRARDRIDEISSILEETRSREVRRTHTVKLLDASASRAGYPGYL